MRHPEDAGGRFRSGTCSRPAVALAASVLFAVFGSAQTAAVEGRTVHELSSAAESWFETYKSQPTLLRAFVRRFPKGADLHTHVGGATYAESYVAWAARDGFCFDMAVKSLTPPPCDQSAGRVPAAQALEDRQLLASIVDSLSTRKAPPAGTTNHEQFFAAFPRFRAVGQTSEKVVEIVERAAAQHVSYLELALFLGRDAGAALSEPALEAKRDLDEAWAYLGASRLSEAVGLARRELDAIEAEVAVALGCASENRRAGCRVERRYIQQANRTRSPDEVFAQLALAFALAQADPRVVGVNLVGPEDNPTALSDYAWHMDVLGFLSRRFPDVNLSLHAGELTRELVSPDHLRSHIRLAVERAGARRIGHGLDIAHEDAALDLFSALRARGILVEICLTSNETILGVRGSDHPFPAYLAMGVPVSLATDDEGILRTELSNEFWRAVRDYDLRYPDLVALARASLAYSFLDGPGLWRSVRPPEPAAACQRDRLGGSDPSPSCAALLAASEKARLQWRLEAELVAFEKLPWLIGNGTAGRPPG